MIDKNKKKDILFSNQPAPMLEKDVVSKVPRKKASKSLESNSNLDFSLYVSSDTNPQISIDSKKSKVNIKMTNVKVGQHVFPPNIKSVGIPSLGKNLKSSTKPVTTDPVQPSHLDLQPVPSKLPKELRTPQFTKAFISKSDEMGNLAT